ncbi:MAG: transcription termination factor Rho, partial [Planctomycetota bacterium]|nr:transcription termination factor Rho [Planctomycetota bacterium]
GGGGGGGQNPAFDEAGLPYGLPHEPAQPPQPGPDEPPFEAPPPEALYGMGVLDLARDGHGFLRNPETVYEPSPDDPYVAPEIVKRYGLRDGVTMEGEMGPPKRRGQNPQLIKPTSICGVAPHLYHHAPKWDELTSIDPDRRIELTRESDDVTLRIIDMLAPIGFGQRGLLVSPPRAGKTTILQAIAKAVEVTYPEAYLMILLIDERPEEATAMQRATRGEVAVSTNDQTPENHVRVTEMVLKKAKRLVESGKDVIILMDSLTRLGRQFNLLQRGGGRTMSGGMDSRALERPKAFFGAARNIEEGGSLTIVATALIETGSRQDQVIFEEFKGTGNMELVLDRQLAEQRLWPAIDVNMSGTRKEEKLIDAESLERIYLLRRVLNRVRPQDAMELLISRMEETPTNQVFLEQMGQASRRADDTFDHSM